MQTRFTLLTILVVLITVSTGFAQPYIIKGSVTDTVNQFALENASITLIRAEDSILVNFTRVKKDGTFTITAPKPNTYILMSVFPGFVDYVDKIEVKKKETDLGEIPMVSRTHLMKEFVFTDQYAAIKVKGDTIEYIADSFAVKDNATVEELLKKLPGLQVDKDGNIMAHGQQVQKLLVDGEEFFTDDPAVVSKSLQAKAVDKVQVFDKKSEQAEFTGIDDGERTRTVNLQLKDNMKKGYFGKVTAGGGKGEVQNYFENQAMLNGFKGKRKLSVFGIVANTGKIGLGWEDRDKFGGGDNTEFTDDGMMVTYSSDDEFDSWNGKYNGQGYPKAWTGGMHYSNKWNEDKHHLASNYRYAKQNIESIDNTITQYVLPDSQYFSKQSQDQFKSGQRHKVDGLYEWKPDSLSTIKLTASGNYTNSINNSVYNSETLTSTGDAANSSERRVSNESTSKRIISSLVWRKKFNKERRTFMLNVAERYEESDAEGYLKAINKFNFNGNGIDTVDQLKQNNNKSFSMTGYTAYTEPLSDVISLEVNYKLSVNNSTAERNTYGKTINNSDAYDELDSLYSNNYVYNIVTHTGGTNLNFDYKKLDFSFGGSVANTNFKQEDLMADTTFAYNVVNLFPKASLRYKISKQTSIRFNYYGSTKQPTIQQIQPLRDNTDPLNIAIGNASLTQEFRHSFRVSANDYKVLSGRWIWTSFSFNLVDNAISRSENVDAYGRRTYQYINMDGNYNAWGYLGIGKRIIKLNMRVGGGGSVSLSKVNNMVNGVKNTSTYNSYTGRFNIGYETKDEKFEVEWNSEVTYNDNNATISTQATSYWTTEHSFDISYDLPWKFEIGTDFNWYIRQRTQVFDRNNNVFRWNAYVSRKFLKNDQLELQVSAYDMLNQNLGFNRYAANNYITENSYNTIRRYGMIRLIWNFTKTAMGAQPEQDAKTIILNN